MSRKCICIVSPNGDSYIGRNKSGSIMVLDVLKVKMVLEPETRRRYFSFTPALPLTWDQTLLIDDLKALCQDGPIYSPAIEVESAYLQVVDNPECIKALLNAYLVECGPCKEWLDQNMPPERRIKAAAGKVIPAFGRELDEGAI